MEKSSKMMFIPANLPFIFIFLIGGFEFLIPFLPLMGIVNIMLFWGILFYESVQNWLG